MSADSLALAEARDAILQVFQAGVAAVDPLQAVQSALEIRDGLLVVQGTEVPAPAGVHVVAVGKAAVAMTRGAIAALNGAIVSGDVITKEGHVDVALPERFRVFEAAHPIPDRRGVDATGAALEKLRTLPAETVVLALISGGGSALLEAPIAGVSLADFALTTNVLLQAGAPIDALNAVRAPLSRVKAGGLRRAAAQSRWVTLILSDVLGNDPRIIASGPTVAGRNDPNLAREVIERFAVGDDLPRSVTAALRAGGQAPIHDESSADCLLIIGDNATAVSAAESMARMSGRKAAVVWSAIEGEAADRGRAFVALAQAAPAGIDVLLGGGETTVTVRGAGVGGRNTEFALAAALELECRHMCDWVIASLGTDGQDAMTGLAGAMADGGTARRARDRGIDPADALERNDSLAVFEAAGGGVETGPTGTNVNDLYIALRTRLVGESTCGEGG